MGGFLLAMMAGGTLLFCMYIVKVRIEWLILGPHLTWGVFSAPLYCLDYQSILLGLAEANSK